MVLLVGVPFLFFIALIAGVVYFAGHDVEGQINSAKAKFLGTPDENAESTRIPDDDLSNERSGKAGGKAVEEKAQAITRDSDGEIDKDAKPRGCTAWFAERVDLDGLMTKFKILLVLFQVGIPQSIPIALPAA
jgi:hypothetical protein